MKLAEAPTDLVLAEPPALINVQEVERYIQKNLTSDFVLRVLEECLFEENSTYNSIDFEQALKDLQQRDSGRYTMLKVLMEGYATKEGMVMVDPKLVSASFKQRLKELELLKSMSGFRRFWYRLGLAVKVLVGQTTKTQALQEAIQITGEVQVAKEELAVLELRKSQAVRDADKMLTEASNHSRQVIESANKTATEASEKIFQQGRQEVSKERTAASKTLSDLYKQIQKRQAELSRLSDPELDRQARLDALLKQGTGSYQTGAGTIAYIPGSRSQSPSASLSRSPSLSASPSISPSASISDSVSPSV